MKSAQILSLVLVSILILPIITSLIEVDNTKYSYELIKNSEEKEGSEKRKSESKNDTDEHEKFLSRSPNQAFQLGLGNPNFFSNKIEVFSLQLVVLTQPPERV